MNPEITIWNKKQKDAQEVKEKAEFKIMAARIYLCQHMPFFGKMTLLLKLKVSEITPTMGTDGVYLFYNPNFVNQVLTTPQLQGVVLHEILHCAFLHLWRRGKRNHERFNQAADYAINPLVIDEGCQLPIGVLLNNQYRDMAAEKIYDMLPNIPKTKVTFIRIGKDGKTSKETKEVSGDWFSDKRHWGKSKKQSKGKQGNKGNQSQKQWGKQNKSIFDKMAGKDKKKEDKLKDYWQGVFTSAIQGTQQGDVPEYLKRFWEEMKPKLNWKTLLSNYLSTSTDDFDFMIPDRRFLEEDYYIPDIRTEEQLENVVIAVDTSGSISNWQFNHFIAEVKAIIDSFPKFKGQFVSCDTEIHDIIEMENGKEFKAQLRGGGGTDFKPVFEKVEEKQWNPKCLVYLTDGYGSFPQEDPGYPVIWLIDSDVEPPFGYKIQYEYDEADKQGF